jgi:circadian clock protein KaiC
MMEDAIKQIDPGNVVIDPITDLTAVGGGREVKSMLTRLNDMMKSRGITTMFTDLLRGDLLTTKPELYVSSLIDSWILLRNIEYNGERNRGLTILKSRGMAHSNQIREFVMSDKGITLIDPYIGPAGVFMGSAKTVQEAKDNAELLVARHDIEHKRNTLNEKRKELEAKIKALRAQYTVDEDELEKNIKQLEQSREIRIKDREIMSHIRKLE